MNTYFLVVGNSGTQTVLEHATSEPFDAWRQKLTETIIAGCAFETKASKTLTTVTVPGPGMTFTFMDEATMERQRARAMRAAGQSPIIQG